MLPTEYSKNYFFISIKRLVPIMGITNKQSIELQCVKYKFGTAFVTF